MDLLCHEASAADLMDDPSVAPADRQHLNYVKQDSRRSEADPAEHLGPLLVLLELESSQEPKSPSYLELQPVIRAGHRSFLVQWLHRACFSLGLELSAFALAVRLLDRFLEAELIEEGQVKEAQCAAVACLAIAAKLDGTPDLITNVASFQVRTDMWLTNFSAHAICDMELRVLKALDWRPMCATAPDFLDRLLAVADVGRHAGFAAAIRSSAIHTIVDVLLDPASVELKPSCLAAFAILANMRNMCPSSEVGRVAGIFFGLLDQAQLAQLTDDFINNFGPATVQQPQRVQQSPAASGSLLTLPLQIPAKAVVACGCENQSPTSVTGMHAQPGTPDSQMPSDLDDSAYGYHASPSPSYHQPLQAIAV